MKTQTYQVRHSGKSPDHQKKSHDHTSDSFPVETQQETQSAPIVNMPKGSIIANIQRSMDSGNYPYPDNSVLRGSKLTVGKRQDQGQFIQQIQSNYPLLQRNGTDSITETQKTDPDQEKFAEIKKALETIPTGKEALKLMEDYKITVKFVSGGGSYYQATSNSMIIDSKHAPTRAALTFVHEINHAKYHHKGMGANVRSSTKQEYIDKMVQEEAEGVVKSIEAKIEFEGTDIDVSKTSYPLEKKYREAYQQAVDEAKVKDSKLTEEQLQNIGREAGKNRVIKGFNDGEVKTSNTKETYPNYYGKYWDKVNNPK